ncbi:hypothetical protein [Streptomyces johnsoniae]|uniref:Nudix hydrolase domain-containing protein n=1 Tax=Streptomyces johnsoniae TaxID=3075532 RepID=A0ABU2SAT8_9ACTN|nr:hypothetical protein [Streptomyces sp. DSM 41886]MDT0445908.1 hypothetical protein [Streptomyces sp. DSM 41886]
MAVSGIGGGELGDAAEYTFGLAPGTRAWPAQQRRKKAAEQCGVTTDHFRKTYEVTICEQVAEEILAALAARAPAPGQDRARDPAPRAEGAVPVPLPGPAPEAGGRAVHTAVGPGLLLDRLADAVRVVIVDPVHRDLAELLERALLRKRERYGEAAFWDELCIVFLSDDLLHLVRDDLTAQFPDPEAAARERRQRAALARRTVMSLLLRRGVPGRWKVYAHRGLMPLPGAVLRMGDGRVFVQLTASPSHLAGPEASRMEFEDLPDQRFESIFNEIVEHGEEDHEVVLVGRPAWDGGSFSCYGARFRRGVMISHQNTHDWLPAVIVITWRRREDQVEPLLEINTPKNSTRELGKVSHLSGYINQRDHGARDRAESGSAPSNFLLGRDTAEAAVRRELLDELGVRHPRGVPRLTGTVPFYYPDKENLYFYIFETELSADTGFVPSVQMHAWTVAELLRVREHQVLGNAVLALTDEHLTVAQRAIAGRIASLNLLLHGHAALAERVAECPPRERARQQLADELRPLVDASGLSRYSAGRELHLAGLAGLQYRSFFTDILPVYAAVGVASAARALSALADDPVRRRAVLDLKSCYESEDMVTALPIEV